jgi:hypothetical protein
LEPSRSGRSATYLLLAPGVTRFAAYFLRAECFTAFFAEGLAANLVLFRFDGPVLLEPKWPR